MSDMPIWEDLAKALYESRECKTVTVGGYNYMITYAMKDRRTKEIEYISTDVEQDHDWCSQDRRDFERKKTNCEYLVTIIFVMKYSGGLV